MNIKTIKKEINHKKIVSDGSRLTKIYKGFFEKNGKIFTTPVLQYQKPRFTDNVDVGYFIKNYNRLGLINTEKI